GDAYDFRYKVPTAYRDYIDDSGEYSLIIPKRQTATDFTIDYVQETLFIDGGYSYIVDKIKPSGGYNQLITSTTLHLDQLGYIETQGNTEYKVYYYKDATATEFASIIKELTIPARKDAPTLSINYKTEKTAQPANSNIRYIISGGSEMRGNGNLIDLNPDTTTKTLRAWYAADSGTFKSGEVVLNIPARPAQPVISYDIATESYLGGNAPTADMEYRASTSTLWDVVNVAYKPMRGTYVYRFMAVEEDITSGIAGAFASLESAVVDYGNKTISVTVKWTDGIGGLFATAHTYNGNVIKPVAEFYTGTSGTDRVPVPSGVIRYAIVDSTGRSENNPTDAETYTVTVSIVDSTGVPDTGYSVSNDTFTYKINKLQVKTLSLSAADRNKIIYNGSDIDITQYIPDYNGSYVNTSNALQRNVSATNYTVRIRLANSNYEWDDGRADDYIDIKWNINPYAVRVMWDSTSFVADGNVHRPTASIVNFESGNINFEYSGDTNASKVHSGYSVSVSIARTDPNYLNYSLSNTTVVFDIILGAGMSLVFIDWTDGAGNHFANGDSLTFNDAVQHPVVTVTDVAGNVITDANVTYADASGNAVSSKWTGSYSVKISIDTSKYAIDGACSDICEYVIVVDASGNGDYKIISIEVGGNYKKNYSTGDSFDSYGMVVYGIYPDGEKVELGNSDYTYSPDGALSEGDNTITVSYGELSATFTVKAGQLVEGGVIDGKWVSQKLYIITVSTVSVLLLLCIILIIVLIRKVGNKEKSAEHADANSVTSDS
ncbi:MAG: bacterial Ig-like domain-containing protein, partial [Clostridia bacterium]|nr:bacterial Ig-like domain-containing protein [Clostridia bacterium]